MEMIQTEKLVYEYEKRDEEGNVIGTSRAIDEVDIEAKEGQFIAILGHNGSGKSTLAKHLNAILMPTEGSVWVDGKNTSNPDELWNVRQSAGMVFQNPDNQIISTVVEEDVGFGPENLGVPTVLMETKYARNPPKRRQKETDCKGSYQKTLIVIKRTIICSNRCLHVR